MNLQLPVMEILLGLGAALGVLGALWRYRPGSTRARVLTVAAGAVAGLAAGGFALAFAFFCALHLTFLAPMSDLAMTLMGIAVLVVLGLPFALAVTRPARSPGKG